MSESTKNKNAKTLTVGNSSFNNCFITIVNLNNTTVKKYIWLKVWRDNYLYLF